MYPIQSNPFLRNKVILVVSPQSWGKMMLAKHHYALELAKAGNSVYFLNPPDNFHWNLKGASKRISIKVSQESPNLSIVDQVLYFPYIFKYHARPLYNFLIRKQIRDILNVIGRPVDILWSFDLGNLFPIKHFPNNIYKIFHPVDEPGDRHAINAASGGYILFSVSREIIDQYASYRIPSYFINHGLAEEFISERPVSSFQGKNINVGMSGNLLRQDLDRHTLLQIVEENPELNFHFYGSHKIIDSNIGAGTDRETKSFIEKLSAFQQVKLHGVLKTAELAEHLNSMDILLICYDIEKDQSKGTNYHKVMEYLSTGKVIVSNNITTYSSEPDLVRMSWERSGNKELPALFRETVANLRSYNSPELMEKRKNFARQNSYRNQLLLINEKIELEMRG
jgi:hypothetical protein